MRPGTQSRHHSKRDRWLVSYADFITLLFVFFVVLYAISKVDSEKYKKVAVGLSSAFNRDAVMKIAIDKPATAKPDEQDILPKGDLGHSLTEDEQDSEQAELRSLGDLLEQKLSGQIADGANADGEASARLFYDERGLVLRLYSDSYFDPKTKKLTKQAEAVLDKVAGALKDKPHKIKIESHTDNSKQGTDSNWEISAVEASAFVRYFTEHQQLDPTRFQISSYGQFRPVGDNETEGGRAENRRVELIFSRQ